MNILQEIFNDYYEEIKYTLHPRDAEMENINKMLGCGDSSFGGAIYACLFPKVAIAMMVSGVMSNILTIHTCVMLFAQLFLMNGIHHRFFFQKSESQVL